MHIKLFLLITFTVAFVTTGCVSKNAHCSTAKSCSSCIDRGCNWTGDHCSKECMMDTYCYGPKNRHATSCPAPKAKQPLNSAKGSGH